MSREEEKIIESGILESYAFGTTSPEEGREIESWLDKSEIIRKELDTIQQGIEQHALKHAVSPPPRVKKRLFALLEDEFTEKDPNFPSLTKNHNLTFWQEKVQNISVPDSFDNLFVHDLNDPIFQTKIVWVKHYIPPETHKHTKEQFLLLEGSCTCNIGDEVAHLKKGDYMEIPLYVSHDFLITSQQAAKFILQREKAV